MKFRATRTTNTISVLAFLLSSILCRDLASGLTRNLMTRVVFKRTFGKESTRLMASSKREDLRRQKVVSEYLCTRSDFAAILLRSAIVFALMKNDETQAIGFSKQPSRQLEFCLVSLARALYWAESVANSLESRNDQDTIRQAYLEAKLGAKALLTGRLGGGSNAKVFMLSTLQITAALHDLEAYSTTGASRSVFADCRADWIEAVSGIVEFDGLDALTDPSPRSSLTLQQFDPKKAAFVRRLLVEKVVPIGRTMISRFPQEARDRAGDYFSRTYPGEMIGNISMF